MLKPKMPFRKVLYKKKASILNTKQIKLPYLILSNSNTMWSTKQIDCLRIVIKRIIKKNYNLSHVKLFNSRFTKKAAGSRMGKGKGAYSHTLHKAVIHSVLFQFDCASDKMALRIYKILWRKISKPLALYVAHNQYIYTNK